MKRASIMNNPLIFFFTMYRICQMMADMLYWI